MLESGLVGMVTGCKRYVQPALSRTSLVANSCTCLMRVSFATANDITGVDMLLSFNFASSSKSQSKKFLE